ncbi:hypothetical protein Bca4012_053879 [Brassica carinata]
MKEIASRISKRKAEPTPFPGKKLRSIPSRRKRAQISPVSIQPHKEIGVSAASVDSCSNLFSAVDDSVSCGSSRVEKSSKKNRIKEEEVSKPGKDVKDADTKFRMITRSYSTLTKQKDGDETEVSESSFTRSDVTFAEHVSDSHRNSNFVSVNKESDVVSFVSAVESCSKLGGDNEEAEISKPSGFMDEVKELKQEVETVGFVSDLACTETFSGEDVSNCYEDEIFSQYSDLDSSDYTQSMFSDSGSEFSEKSRSGSPVSHSRSLFLQYKEQFRRSAIPNDFDSSLHEQNRETQSELVRFEDEEVEESYQMLRERERSHAYLREYAKAYCSRMDPARANPEVERVAKSLAVASLADHTQLCFWPSSVAAGLVVLACIKHNKISAYQRVIKVHVRTKDNDLPECVKVSFKHHSHSIRPLILH